MTATNIMDFIMLNLYTLEFLKCTDLPSLISDIWPFKGVIKKEYLLMIMG